jgi:hypothetical protein
MPKSLTIEQYLQAVAPTVAADPSVSVYIQMAEERTNKEFYGQKTNQAIALLAAHIAFLFTAVPNSHGAGSGSGEGGSTGSITSKREGDLSVSFGSGAVSSASIGVGDADLAQTRWGLMLLALRKGCKPFMGVLNGGACGRC